MSTARPNIRWTVHSQQYSTSKPSISTLLTALKLCCIQRNMERGKIIHHVAIRAGFDTSKHVASSLLNMYSQCKSMLLAQQVFDILNYKDVVIWNVLILGYTVNGEAFKALQTLSRLQKEGCAPNAGTFVAALKACIRLAEREAGVPVKLYTLQLGMSVHSYASAWNLDIDRKVSSCLLDMYSKCNSVVDARSTFDLMKTHDVVAWTAMMLGYVANGDFITCLELFQEMQRQSCVPNARTYLAALKACSSMAQREQGVFVNGFLVKLRSLNIGMALHSQAFASNQVDEYVNNSLIGMYSHCGSLKDAHRVFDMMVRRDAVSWTTLMLGYVDCGDNRAALQLFSEMQSAGCQADAMTYSAALRACSRLAKEEPNQTVLEAGMAIHSSACKTGLLDRDVFVANTLVDMYVKCGSLTDAHRVLERIEDKNSLPACNTLLDGYAENDKAETALKFFESMKQRDGRTYAAALKACSRDGTYVGYGKNIHGEICKGELENDDVMVRSLVDFYAKTGSIVDAQFMFDSSVTGTGALESVSTWTALMAGYSRRCESERVVELFGEMQEAGVSPDSAAFLVALTACSHAGRVDQGRRYFTCMQEKYGLVPGIEHYNCFMNLVGRASQVDCVMNLLSNMPHQANAVTWTSILGALL